MVRDVVGHEGGDEEVAMVVAFMSPQGQWLARGSARGRTDVPKIVDWYMDGKINIDDLITHKLKLEDINQGFDLMKSGESIRSVVMY